MRRRPARRVGRFACEKALLPLAYGGAWCAHGHPGHGGAERIPSPRAHRTVHTGEASPTAGRARGCFVPRAHRSVGGIRGRLTGIAGTSWATGGSRGCSATRTLRTPGISRADGGIRGHLAARTHHSVACLPSTGAMLFLRSGHVRAVQAPFVQSGMREPIWKGTSQLVSFIPR